MRDTHRLTAIAALCLLSLALGCGPMDRTEELQSLAGSAAQDEPAEVASPSSPGRVAAGGDALDFPPVGSVFPSLGGRLHSALCDPTADALSGCL